MHSTSQPSTQLRTFLNTRHHKRPRSEMSSEASHESTTTYIDSPKMRLELLEQPSSEDKHAASIHERLQYETLLAPTSSQPTPPLPSYPDLNDSERSDTTESRYIVSSSTHSNSDDTEHSTPSTSRHTITLYTQTDSLLNIGLHSATLPEATPIPHESSTDHSNGPLRTIELLSLLAATKHHQQATSSARTESQPTSPLSTYSRLDRRESSSPTESRHSVSLSSNSSSDPTPVEPQETSSLLNDFNSPIQSIQNTAFREIEALLNSPFEEVKTLGLDILMAIPTTANQDTRNFAIKMLAKNANSNHSMQHICRTLFNRALKEYNHTHNMITSIAVEMFITKNFDRAKMFQNTFLHSPYRIASKIGIGIASSLINIIPPQNQSFKALWLFNSANHNNLRHQESFQELFFETLRAIPSTPRTELLLEYSKTSTPLQSSLIQDTLVRTITHSDHSERTTGYNILETFLNSNFTPTSLEPGNSVPIAINTGIKILSLNEIHATEFLQKMLSTPLTPRKTFMVVTGIERTTTNNTPKPSTIQALVNVIETESPAAKLAAVRILSTTPTRNIKKWDLVFIETMKLLLNSNSALVAKTLLNKMASTQNDTSINIFKTLLTTGNLVVKTATLSILKETSLLNRVVTESLNHTKAASEEALIAQRLDILQSLETSGVSTHPNFNREQVKRCLLKQVLNPGPSTRFKQARAGIQHPCPLTRSLYADIAFTLNETRDFALPHHQHALLELLSGPASINFLTEQTEDKASSIIFSLNLKSVSNPNYKHTVYNLVSKGLGLTTGTDTPETPTDREQFINRQLPLFLDTICIDVKRKVINHISLLLKHSDTTQSTRAKELITQLENSDNPACRNLAEEVLSS